MYPLKLFGGLVLLIVLAWACSNMSVDDSPQQPAVFSNPPREVRPTETPEVRAPTATPEDREGDFMPFFLLMGEANAFAEMLQQHHSDFAITRDEERYQCAEVTDALVKQQRFVDEVEQRIADNRPVVHNSFMVAYDLEQLRKWAAQSPKFLADLEAHRDECARVGLLP